MLTAVPAGYEGRVTPYDDRGWPSFEQRVTMMLKMQSLMGWNMIVDVGNPCAKPHVPLTAASFETLLESKTFTNNADSTVVAKLYAKTMHEALGMTPLLRFPALKWGDDEMKQLVEVLPECTALRGLNLKNNKFTLAGATMLARCLNDGAMPKLLCIGGYNTMLLESPELKAACDARGIALQGECDMDDLEKLGFVESNA